MQAGIKLTWNNIKCQGFGKVNYRQLRYKKEMQPIKNRYKKKKIHNNNDDTQHKDKKWWHNKQNRKNINNASSSKIQCITKKSNYPSVRMSTNKEMSHHHQQQHQSLVQTVLGQLHDFCYSIPICRGPNPWVNQEMSKKWRSFNVKLLRTLNGNQLEIWSQPIN